MPATQPSNDLHPLCHEHHLEMKLNLNLLTSEGDGTQAVTHVCAVPDCLLHYNTSRGYFILNQNGNRGGVDMVPKLRCFLDGAPMYLAETNPEKRDFRLWICPQCGARRTNEGDLIGLASQEGRNSSGKNAPESKSADTPHI